jgi:gas vesicle protein
MGKFFSGLVTGVVLGLMFAPDKGSETRRRVSRTGEDIKHTFSDLVDSAKEGYESIKKGVNNLKKKHESEDDNEAYGRNAENAWPPA